MGLSFFSFALTLPFSIPVRLAKRLSNSDDPQYSALCHLAVARCQQSVGNAPLEAEALVAASRAFMRAEDKTQAAGCPSFEEHLLAGEKTIMSLLDMRGMFISILNS